MGRVDEDGDRGAFSELAALLRRNEDEQRRVEDVETDMQRLLLLAHDAALREQLVQAQGVRRVTLLAKTASSAHVQRFCSGVLGCLAHSERGRLSASSCTNWQCASHRHNCPLSMLLLSAQSSQDRLSRLASAAALLAFSVQNECQLQIDSLSGVHALLRIIDAADVPGGDGELAVYAAATLWNMCKAPVLLLKIETLHAILKDKLLRKLSRLLLVPLKPFQLALTTTRERGAAALIDFEGDNLNVLLTSYISTQLSVVLSVESYTGRARTLADQYRARSAGSNRIKDPGGKGRRAAGSSVAHYDESGVLASRTCAVCGKSISSTSSPKRFLLCSREGCDQVFHVRCSRWAALGGQDRHPEHFHCDVCRVAMPLYYWDFVAENPREYTKLLTQTMFEAVRITRVDVSGLEEESSSVMLFDAECALVGVGVKKYRVAASSRDPEMVIVLVTHLLVDVSPAMQQQQRPSGGTVNEISRSTTAWPVSYARQDSSTAPTVKVKRKTKTPAAPIPRLIQVEPGAALFWPASHTRDVRALQYTESSLHQLEHAAIYEFRGGGHCSSEDARPATATVMFAIGAPVSQTPMIESTESLLQGGGIWSSLLPRRAACMKLLVGQLGRLRVTQPSSVPVEEGDVVTRSTLRARAKSRPNATALSTSKPHFPGKKLHRIAVATTTTSIKD